MEIATLGGITKNINQKKSEFTIHFPITYDYRFNATIEK
jgi:hypothetical protein